MLAAATQMSDWRPILQLHFHGEDGSFLMHLREFHWDRAAFDQLVHAMKSCCIEVCAAEPDSEALERWIATGFWDTETYARMSLSHPSFRLDHSSAYFKAAIELLHELSYWYFMGESPSGPDADPELYPLDLPD